MEFEPEDIQSKIDDQNIKEETRMELQRPQKLSEIAITVGVPLLSRCSTKDVWNPGKFATQDSAVKSENLFRTKLKFIGLCDSNYYDFGRGTYQAFG